MNAVVNSWIAYCEFKHRKTPLVFIVPLAEALMVSGKLNAQYQRCRGAGRPSKTSRSLLNVGDHLSVTKKNNKTVVHKCAQQKNESLTKIICTMCNVPLCIDRFKPNHS
ncbi:piggyBac transposable element-derived protein 4 [Trichonephila clavata]|uniref:PiggyBac transposable element-derived protein 4 n=1 Tax=Trichonephila clavata TaxID=2740835 RepID=A0A8X6HMJ1_TRICU|nr:piggyBac transposable element-derived protein 4 [Trichonephila clavata]